MMLGAEDGSWYSSQYFSVNEHKIIANWSGKVAGYLIGTKPDINYLWLFAGDSKDASVDYGSNTLTNLKLLTTPTLWQKFISFWKAQ